MRPKIVFLFGTHHTFDSNPAILSNLEEDSYHRDFFRDTMMAAIESGCALGYKKIVIFHEGVISKEEGDLTKAELVEIFKPIDRTSILWQKLQKWAKRGESQANKKELPGFFIEGKCYVNNPDWGFAEFLRNFHTENPDIITHRLEPAGADNTYFDIQRHNSGVVFTDNWRFLPNETYMQLLRQSTLYRDFLLIEAINEIISTEPETLFIIPRGSGHIGIISAIDTHAVETEFYIEEKPFRFKDHVLSYPYNEKIPSCIWEASILLEQLLSVEFFKININRLQNNIHLTITEENKLIKATMMKVCVHNPGLANMAWFNPLVSSPLDDP